MLQLESVRQALKDAANHIRALPDEELVALALRSSGSPTKALRDEIAESVPRRAPTRRKPVRPLKARSSRRDAESTGRGAVVQAVHDALTSTPVTTVELAASTGLSTKSVGDAVRRLVAAGRATLCSGGGKGNPGTYAVAGRATGRQRGARKAKPVSRATTDEEEGADMFAVASTLPPPPPVPADLVPPLPDLGELDMDAFRDRVVELVAERGPIRWGDIVGPYMTRRNYHQVSHGHLIALIRAKRLYALEGVGLDTVVSATPPVPTAAERSLPIFEPHAGDRHEDCSHYKGCLDRFFKRFPSAQNARCPADCASHAPVSRDARIHAAMAGRSQNAGVA